MRSFWFYFASPPLIGPASTVASLAIASTLVMHLLALNADIEPFGLEIEEGFLVQSALALFVGFAGRWMLFRVKEQRRPLNWKWVKRVLFAILAFAHIWVAAYLLTMIPMSIFGWIASDKYGDIQSGPLWWTVYSIVLWTRFTVYGVGCIIFAATELD